MRKASDVMYPVGIDQNKARVYVKRKKRHLEECGVCEMFKHLFLIIYIRLYFSVVPAIWKCVHYCVSCMFLVFLAYVFGVFLFLYYGS